ncbi:hypothetical protein NQ315_006884 [Exocentrus adspersus]|uniref:Uncharacterized protein n=1 Tax=Exocentrus adspersus TaxID=1586481 RepID=A0AAV8WCQ3_9CUCU|nr:hypothetical protein NQ315_006884 [Exocentrus adspersus]
MTMSMSSDGWRPIVGTRRQPPGFPSVEIKAQEITEYKDPSQTVEVDIIKAQTLEPPSTISPQKLSTKIIPLDPTNNNINGSPIYKQGEKIPPHAKFTSPGPYHTLPASVHGPPIPIGGVSSKPYQFGQMKYSPKTKRPINKPSTPSFLGPKRKPIRGPMVSHSNRNEVFVRPPASFPFLKPVPSNIKTRETQGLGLLSANHFLVNQQGNTEFVSRFALPPTEENFQNAKNHPVTYIFSKPTNDVPYQFKSQNDEYTRNLVPPPPLAMFQQDTDKIKPIKLSQKVTENVVASTEPVVKFADLNNNVQFGIKPSVQENLVPQLQPPFEQNFAFQKQIPKGQAVDVQVTKEKFKVFHSNPPVNYNTNLPKVQTYEVTEGKWIDSPNPFTFSITRAQPLIAQPLQQMTPTARPQLVTEPIVELNLPPFLPTPYRPENAVPTSPTQSEISTIFSQVSTKMNRYKNEALTTNPFFFDVKEVSTHYPILGVPESPTSDPMNLNSEVLNEITTAVPVTNKTPQTTKSRRRRPRPRRPSSTTTTTTTTTTEEPVAMESYESQKTEENVEEVSTETERPQRRRPKPNRIRQSSSEERPLRYRTTTPPSEGDESHEKRVRTRHRTRQRGSAVKSENRGSTRKRIRPVNADMPSNHKLTESDPSPQPNEPNEPYIEQVQSMEHERQGLFETKFPEDNAPSSDTKTNRIEYESPHRNVEPTQYEEESKYETTIVSNDLSPVRKPVYEENSEETERTQVYERTRPTISETTLPETTVNINSSPENDVDYSTPVADTEQTDERIATTVATTTLPTTTTVETTTATKSHRIRGRPLKSRPKFSVKDYRQRLNQYTSTTPSTTTDIMKTTSEGSVRLRFPTRLRTRPTSRTTTTTTESYNPDEEDEESEPIRRGGFRPKEPRHSTTTENIQNNIITEKNVKSVTTRLRPFGRHRSTTEPSVSQKVSIKPNLFSVRRRLPPLSLRNRILNKVNATEATTTNESEPESTEPVTVQETETELENTPTESNTIKTKTETTTDNESTTTTTDVNEDDYIQRVSDLTSSFKNEYETPGLFNSVSPNSRRIPNYFTISTDDPILPIEAFFPNIKDKEQK